MLSRANIGLFPEPSDLNTSKQYEIMNPTQITILHCERAILTILFLVLLYGTFLVIFRYLYKLKMYKSFLLVITYAAILLLTATNIVYEIFTGFSCKEEDCSAIIYSVDTSEDQPVIQKYMHKFRAVFIFWELKQQGVVILLAFQGLIGFTLLCRLRHITNFLKDANQSNPQILERRIRKTEARLVICQYVVSFIIVGFALFVITMFKPIGSFHTKTYLRVFRC